jgi:putative phosphoesterase
MLTIGVLADTHIPDRARHLDPEVIVRFRDAGVGAILHAGDVSVPAVLSQLELIAPVYAVKGNRDVFLLRNLPIQREESWNGVRIGLTHGHLPWRNYLFDRVHFKLHGYDHERLIPRLLDTFTQVDVIVFGHGHLPLNENRNGRLLFNPGSPHFPARKGQRPSIGFLHISLDSTVRAEILYLNT